MSEKRWNAGRVGAHIVARCENSDKHCENIFSVGRKHACTGRYERTLAFVKVRSVLKGFFSYTCREEHFVILSTNVLYLRVNMSCFSWISHLWLTRKKKKKNSETDRIKESFFPKRVRETNLINPSPLGIEAKDRVGFTPFDVAMVTLL